VLRLKAAHFPATCLLLTTVPHPNGVRRLFCGASRAGRAPHLGLPAAHKKKPLTISRQT
jgi:hypothetical protein